MASSPSSCVALSSGVSHAAELGGEEQSKQSLSWDTFHVVLRLDPSQALVISGQALFFPEPGFSTLAAHSAVTPATGTHHLCPHRESRDES